MKWISIIPIMAIFLTGGLHAQNRILPDDFTLLENRYHQAYKAVENENNDEREEYPSPRSVMYKSLMIPGWGQIENRQIWKVPIIYGLFTGIGLYTHFLHEQYNDYRAAYYNTVQGPGTDYKFGPTPEHLEGINQNQLQANRNSLRNQRDFMFVVMGLAYGLNALDAYVFAHMRSFDVSDDLSARTEVGPAIMADGTPGVRVSLSLSKRR
jgi:hypothetical protein